MEIEKIVISIFIAIIFGFAVFSYIKDFSSDASVTLDENYTKLSGDFETSLSGMNDLGIKMESTLESKGGFTVTTAVAVVGQVMYAVAKMPLTIIKLIWTLITDMVNVIGLGNNGSIYIGAAISIITLLMVFGLISLLFRKDI